MPDFLHNRDDFADLLRIVAGEEGIGPALVEKDYWIMHCLHGLQLLGLSFELKGGTSLSKGFGLIRRFSEDIDIRIEPPEGMGVKTGRNHDKPAHRESRRKFYDWLAGTIRIDGIVEVGRNWAGNPLGLLAFEGVLNGLGYWVGGEMKKWDKKDAPAPRAV